MKNNVQRHAFLLTINNPKDHGVTHESIRDTLKSDFSTLRYFCMADEIGEKQTYHTHLYVYFDSRVRFEKVKKSFPSAHIDTANGTPEDNRAYVRKEGKWADTEKAETRVDGTFEEEGEMPLQNSKNTLMTRLYQLVTNGWTDAEIIHSDPEFISYLTDISRVRTTILNEHFKNTRRLDLKVIYIFGETGTGKTRYVLDEHGDGSVYKINSYEHPFDSYACQPVMLFDEYRSQIRISDMLSYLDIYPVELPARYSNRVMCAEKIYFTSNWRLEDQYKNIQDGDAESWKAFLRRIHEVWMFDGNEVKKFSSVQAYFDSNNGFRKITEQEIKDIHTLFQQEGGERNEQMDEQS